MSNVKEILLALAAVAAFWAYPLLAQHIDPAARSIDLSYVHLLIMRILGLVVSVLVVWVLLHVAFPTLDGYTKEDASKVPSRFADDFASMPPTARALTFLGTILFLVWTVSG